MSEKENQLINNQESVIEDLTVNHDQAAEVKGGTIYKVTDVTLKRGVIE